MLTIFAITACRKDNAIPQNLISNSSFENNGNPSFQGWTGNLYAFVNNVPANGGQWSLQLAPGWVPDEGFAETFVTGLSGNYIFKLTCDAKTIYWSGGVILRLQNQNGITTDLSKTTFNNTTWSTITLTTNATLQPTDKLIIHLTAGMTEIPMGKVLFDKVRLEIQY